MRAISLALLLLSARPGSGRLSRRRGSASLFTVHLSQPAVASEVFSALLPSKRADTRGEGEGGLLAACAHLVQAVAVCVVSLALTGEARRLVRSLLPLVGGDRTCAPPMSEELALSLRNATLSALELEMSAALVFPSSIEACAGGQEALAETLAEAAETQDSLGLGAVLGPVRGVLLYGPPGCGKSTLARALSKRLGRPLLALTPSSLLRKYVGDTSQLLRAAFSLAAKLGPCVLLVDEMDALFRARADGDNELDRSLKTEFMQLWDGAKGALLVVGATNRPQDLDQAVTRRFERALLIGPPDRAARAQIFAALVADERFDCDAAAALTPDYTPSDIVALCRAAMQSLVREHRRASALTPGLPLRALSVRDVAQAMTSVFPTAWAAASYGAADSALAQPAVRRATEPSEEDRDEEDEDD